MAGAGLLQQALPADLVAFRQLCDPERESGSGGAGMQLGRTRQQLLDPDLSDGGCPSVDSARERAGRERDLRRVALELQRRGEARFDEPAGPAPQPRIGRASCRERV